MREQGKYGIAVALALWLAGNGLADKAGAPATFYTPMASEAIHLMPAHFRKILTQRQSHLLTGLNTSYAAAPEGGDPPLMARIEAQVERIKARLAENVPFNDMVADYGVLARLVAELEDPAHGQPAAIHAPLRKEFHALMEKKHGKFPPVFYGFEATLFQSRDLKAFLNGIAQRAQLAGERLAKTYAADGRVKAFADADERSPAFGIAALYYSHTVSDVANIWLYIWWESYGDMRGTPFFDGTVKP